MARGTGARASRVVVFTLAGALVVLVGCGSSMRRAIEQGNVGDVQRQLRDGADPHEPLDTPSCKQTPPLAAAMLRPPGVDPARREMVRALLEAGADPNRGGCCSAGTGGERRKPCSPCPPGRSCCLNPVHLAVKSGDFELVRMLLRAGADPNRQLPCGEPWLTTIAVASVMSGVYTLENLEELLAAGADPNIRDRVRRQWTPIEAAVRNAGSPAQTQLAIDVARVLLKHGADVNDHVTLDSGVFGRRSAVDLAYDNRALLEFLAQNGGRSACWDAWKKECPEHRSNAELFRSIVGGAREFKRAYDEANPEQDDSSEPDQSSNAAEPSRACYEVTRRREKEIRFRCGADGKPKRITFVSAQGEHGKWCTGGGAGLAGAFCVGELQDNSSAEALMRDMCECD
jgi:hypothetical protein